jgi:hypothetical protein
MAKLSKTTSTKGPLTPPLERQGPQGVIGPPPTRLPPTETTPMPMRPIGPTPRGNPSATPRPGK